MSASRRQVARSLLTHAYVPTLLAEIGIGAMLPVLALSVVDMGHTAVFGSLAVAAYQLGRLPGSALGGSLGHRRGPAHAALLSLGIVALGSIVAAWGPDLAVFMGGAAVVGLGHASFHVARQGQIHAIIPPDLTARSLTTLAGVWRISNFIGPLLGAALIAAIGIQATYWFGAAMVGAGAAALVAAGGVRERPLPPEGPRPTLLEIARENLPVLRTLGVAVIITGALRQARLSVIPLWATHVGLSPETATLVFSVSAAIDMLLFYPAGVAMDTRGRRWTAIPSTLLLSLGFLALPFTHGVAQVTVAALVIGVGNGWGSGMIMTLGADAAPARGRDVFIGLWMILQDVGGLAGPALISLGALIALPTGYFAVGGMGLAATAGFTRWIPRAHAPGHVAD